MIRIVDKFTGILEEYPEKESLADAKEILEQWMEPGDRLCVAKNSNGTETVYIVTPDSEDLDIHAVLPAAVNS